MSIGDVLRTMFIPSHAQSIVDSKGPAFVDPFNADVAKLKIGEMFALRVSTLVGVIFLTLGAGLKYAIATNPGVIFAGGATAAEVAKAVLFTKVLIIAGTAVSVICLALLAKVAYELQARRLPA